MTTKIFEMDFPTLSHSNCKIQLTKKYHMNIESNSATICDDSGLVLWSLLDISKVEYHCGSGSSQILILKQRNSENFFRIMGDIVYVMEGEIVVEAYRHDCVYILSKIMKAIIQFDDYYIDYKNKAIAYSVDVNLKSNARDISISTFEDLKNPIYVDRLMWRIKDRLSIVRDGVNIEFIEYGGLILPDNIPYETSMMFKKICKNW